MVSKRQKRLWTYGRQAGGFGGTNLLRRYSLLRTGLRQLLRTGRRQKMASSMEYVIATVVIGHAAKCLRTLIITDTGMQIRAAAARVQGFGWMASGMRFQPLARSRRLGTEPTRNQRIGVASQLCRGKSAFESAGNFDCTKDKANKATGSRMMTS